MKNTCGGFYVRVGQKPSAHRLHITEIISKSLLKLALCYPDSAVNHQPPPFSRRTRWHRWCNHHSTAQSQAKPLLRGIGWVIRDTDCTMSEPLTVEWDGIWFNWNQRRFLPHDWSAFLVGEEEGIGPNAGVGSGARCIEAVNMNAAGDGVSLHRILSMSSPGLYLTMCWCFPCWSWNDFLKWTDVIDLEV